MVSKADLHSLSFFAGIKPAGLEILSRCAQPADFPEGAVVLREGKRAEGFHVIASGNAVVEMESGGGARELQTLAPGDIVGWSWVTPFKNWHFSIAASRDLKTYWFNAAEVESALAPHPRLHLEVMKRIVGAMAERIEFLEDLLRRDEEEAG